MSKANKGKPTAEYEQFVKRAKELFKVPKIEVDRREGGYQKERKQPRNEKRHD